jgi:hypothetical protein
MGCSMMSPTAPAAAPGYNRDGVFRIELPQGNTLQQRMRRAASTAQKAKPQVNTKQSNEVRVPQQTQSRRSRFLAEPPAFLLRSRARPMKGTGAAYCLLHSSDQ